MAMMSGVARATYDDVTLILQLYEMRREDRLREARKWFTGSFKVKSYDDFTALCPPGSEPNASYRMVTTYWEMVASFQPTPPPAEQSNSAPSTTRLAG